MQKEEFSGAYVRAVAAVAGLSIASFSVDEDSIDIGFKRKGGYSPQMDVQLKCTADALPANGDLPFPLKKKNYDDLIRPRLVPAWLVVLWVPDQVGNWIHYTSDANGLILRYRAWWIALDHLKPSSNKTSVTVRLPRDNVFNADALKRRMDEIDARVKPV